MTVGPAPHSDRTPAKARVAGLLGALGLCGVAWLDTWADGPTAHLAFVAWAAFGIGVCTAGIILQCGRIRADRDARAERSGSAADPMVSPAHTLTEGPDSTASSGTSHNEGIAAGLVPAPRQESSPGVTPAQEAHASGTRNAGEARVG
ncbi:hypothetical protein [Streptomyces indicus]|uniref:hypothetical protein n=1 Tax=Streptomyces indicus TaxID=417292 RepID=UPI001FE930BD|nr:hypothetical protein [Streptomyces indicus]